MYKSKKANLLGHAAALLFSYTCIWLLTMGSLAMVPDVCAKQSWLVVLEKDFSLTEDLFGNWQGIQTGFRILVNDVLKECSEYYGVWIPAIGVRNGGEAEIVAALLFLALAIFLWEALCVLCFQRKLPAILPGVLIFALNLLVGYVPDFLSILLFLSGSFGILPLCGNRHGKKGKENRGRIQTYQAFCGGCLIAGLLMGLMVTNLVAGKYTVLAKTLHQDVKNWQKNLETKVANLDFGGLWQLESGAVTNRTPDYEGKIVMQLSVTKMPEGTVYLRGYVGDTYKNGTWINTSVDDFSKETASWPKDIRTGAGINILNMAYRTAIYLDVAAPVNYSVSYVDTGNDYAYLPYFTDLGAVSHEAESIILRHGAKSLTVPGVATFPAERMKDILSEQTTLSKWYESYTEKYLTVPQDLKQIKELGGNLTLQLRTLYDHTGREENSTIRRISAAELVRQELSRRAQYTLALPRVPFGKDVVEYFLFDSGRGFCQHYAAAGVLLLREMGIPARYVTGYAVFRDAFQWQEDGVYVADVKDEDAHAWAEIYLDGLGWFPIEMTEAQSGSSDLSDTFEYFVEWQGQSEESAPNPTDEGQEPKQSSDDTWDDEVKDAGRLWVFVPAVPAVWAVYYFAQRVKKRLYVKKNERKAVRDISERTYRILRRKGKLGVGKIDDKAFRETLMTKLKQIPKEERKAYLDVLERAAFDCNEISREDVQLCLRFYKKVKGI